MFNQVILESFLNKMISLALKDMKYIILLDYASIVHLFIIKNLVSNMRKAKHILYLRISNCMNTIMLEAE